LAVPDPRGFLSSNNADVEAEADPDPNPKPAKFGCVAKGGGGGAPLPAPAPAPSTNSSDQLLLGNFGCPTKSSSCVAVALLAGNFGLVGSVGGVVAELGVAVDELGGVDVELLAEAKEVLDAFPKGVESVGVSGCLGGGGKNEEEDLEEKAEEDAEGTGENTAPASPTPLLLEEEEERLGLCPPMVILRLVVLPLGAVAVAGPLRAGKAGGFPLLSLLGSLGLGFGFVVVVGDSTLLALSDESPNGSSLLLLEPKLDLDARVEMFRGTVSSGLVTRSISGAGEEGDSEVGVEAGCETAVSLLGREGTGGFGGCECVGTLESEKA